MYFIMRQILGINKYFIQWRFYTNKINVSSNEKFSLYLARNVRNNEASRVLAPKPGFRKEFIDLMKNTGFLSMPVDQGLH